MNTRWGRTVKTSNINELIKKKTLTKNELTLHQIDITEGLDVGQHSVCHSAPERLLECKEYKKDNIVHLYLSSTLIKGLLSARCVRELTWCPLACTSTKEGPRGLGIWKMLSWHYTTLLVIRAHYPRGEGSILLLCFFYQVPNLEPFQKQLPMGAS